MKEVFSPTKQLLTCDLTRKFAVYAIAEIAVSENVFVWCTCTSMQAFQIQYTPPFSAVSTICAQAADSYLAIYIVHAGRQVCPV